MESIDYKTLYESTQEENRRLKEELSEKASIIQILYSDMDDINQQLNHYKDMFSAANTNLMDNDKKVYDLNDTNTKIQNENYKLKQMLDNQKLEISELKKKNDTNNTFINSQYKIINTNDIVETTNIIEEKESDRYELIPIDIITKWIIDYINSGCTFSLMVDHTLTIQKQSSYQPGKQVTIQKTFKNNKWTLRVLLKLFFMYHFPSQLKYLYSNEKIQNDTCTICYNQVENPSILSCDCKHIYCHECITKWLHKHKGGCPCCRQKSMMFEAGPITPMHYRLMLDTTHSISSIPPYLRIFV